MTVSAESLPFQQSEGVAIFRVPVTIIKKAWDVSIKAFADSLRKKNWGQITRRTFDTAKSSIRSVPSKAKHTVVERRMMVSREQQEITEGPVRGMIEYFDDTLGVSLEQIRKAFLFVTPEKEADGADTREILGFITSGRSLFEKASEAVSSKGWWSWIQYKGIGNVIRMLQAGHRTIKELSDAVPENIALFTGVETVGGRVGADDPVEFGLTELRDILLDGRNAKRLSHQGLRSRMLIAAVHLTEILDSTGNLVILPRKINKGEGIFATRCPLSNLEMQHAILNTEHPEELSEIVNILKESLVRDHVDSARALVETVGEESDTDFLQRWIVWYASVQAAELSHLHKIAYVPMGTLHGQNLNPAVEFKDTSDFVFTEEVKDNQKSHNVRECILGICMMLRALEFQAEHEGVLLRESLIEDSIRAFVSAYGDISICKVALEQVSDSAIAARFQFKPSEFEQLAAFEPMARRVREISLE